MTIFYFVVLFLLVVVLVPAAIIATRWAWQQPDEVLNGYDPDGDWL